VSIQQGNAMQGSKVRQNSHAVEEVAETAGLSKRKLDRQWTYTRAWLFREIREQM
jgi:hypothetical protein